MGRFFNSLAKQSGLSDEDIKSYESQSSGVVPTPTSKPAPTPSWKEKPTTEMTVAEASDLMKQTGMLGEAPTPEPAPIPTQAPEQPKFADQSISEMLKVKAKEEADNQYVNNLITNMGDVPEGAKMTIPLLKKALESKGITDPDTLAYVLATVNHESGFVPKDEIQAGMQDPQWLKDAQANYDGGWQYHGRGHIQLTGKSNYDDIGKKIGVDLVNNPDLANDPKIAAEITAQFVKDRGVTDYTQKGDFYNARTPINGDTWNYQKVADEATRWKKAIAPPMSPEETVRSMSYR